MRLNVETRGEGPVRVVLVHGSPGSPAHLRPLAEHLADRFTTHIVHLPGYGMSAPLVPYELDHAHTLVEDVLLELGITDAHFIGTGEGAHRAFALAARGEVNVLSVVSIGGTINVSPEDAADFRARAEALRAGDEFPWASLLSPNGLANEFAVADVREWPRGAVNLPEELEALANAIDLRPALAKLPIPMLLRVGALDRPERSRAVQAIARRSTLEEVPDAGHALLAEDFVETARSVRRFLESCVEVDA